MHGNGTLLTIYRGISIIVLAAGVISVFAMSNTLIRLDERMMHVEFRLGKIEVHHETPNFVGSHGRPD